MSRRILRRAILKLIKLLIADLDKYYLDALSNYIIFKHSDKFKIVVGSDSEFLKNALNIEGNFDIVITANQLKYIFENNINMLVLFDEEGSEKEIDGFKTIYKYQNGDEIVSDILDIYLEDKKTFSVLNSKTNENCNVLGFASLAGGVGKTTISSMVAKFAASQGISTFYLNLESNQSHGAFYSQNVKRGISSVFFCVNESSKILNCRIDASKSIDSRGGSYFRKPDSIFDLDELTNEQKLKIINSIKDSNKYKLLILDFDTGIKKTNLDLFKNCDKLFLIQRETICGNIKLENASNELMKNEESKGFLGETNLIINCHKENSIEIQSYKMFNEVINIPYIKEDKLMDDNFSYEANPLLNRAFQSILDTKNNSKAVI